MSVKCPKCQTVNPNTSSYCADCGTQLVSMKDVSVTKTLQESIVSLGKTIAGKYHILEELGRGGMGVVYKAEDMRLDRVVALKFLPEELIRDEEAKKRFIQEAKAAAALNHPNICTIHEIDEEEGKSFIVMEYVKGLSLKEKIESGSIKPEEALNIAIQTAEGLEAAHKGGIVHRDVKTGNIMVTADGQVKIMDLVWQRLRMSLG